MNISVRFLPCNNRFHHLAAASHKQRVVEKEAQTDKPVGIIGGLLIMPPARFVSRCPAFNKFSVFLAYRLGHTFGGQLRPVLQPSLRLQFAKLKRPVRLLSHLRVLQKRLIASCVSHARLFYSRVRTIVDSSRLASQLCYSRVNTLRSHSSTQSNRSSTAHQRRHKRYSCKLCFHQFVIPFYTYFETIVADSCHQQ